MPDRPVFTLEAANALVPKLSTLVARQLDRRQDIESRLRALAELVGEVPNEIVPNADDSSNVRSLKLDLLDRISEYQQGWREVEELGCVVKDARTGLVDFFGEVDGHRVWLCWKYGEPEIGFFHGLDEGYSGRRAIRASERRRLLN
jgi:hypothetical protein